MDNLYYFERLEYWAKELKAKQLGHYIYDKKEVYKKAQEDVKKELSKQKKK